MSKLFRSPIFVFLVALVIFIGLARFGFAANLFVLLDLSQSVSSKDFTKSDFHKNLQAISRYILELDSGHSLKIIGITESSFQRPHVLLSGSTPSRSGFFQEKLKKRKLDLYRR